MKKTVFSPGAFPLLPFLMVLLFASGCAQRQVFDFSVPLAKTQNAQPNTPSDNAHNGRVSVALETAPAETYPLEASVAQPTPARFSSGSALSSAPSSKRPINPKGSTLLDKRLLQFKKQVEKAAAKSRDLKAGATHKKYRQAVGDGQEEKTPQSKSVRTLIGFGLAAAAVSLVVGLFGVWSLLGAGWVLLGFYLAFALLGALFFVLAMSKISKSPDPSIYARDKKIAKVGFLLSVLPAAILLGIFFLSIVLAPGL
ncbi:hypothetical protein GU926_11440 [Nibribacter ruber]|uniref:Uncharacterized protein n=1 Tax=Nibribacter ruber TaxID=2698458 RepID=A0A6P1P0S1_9BACT|nr:hypothetical protein [Nibribacter ruber]QHL88008.1 hypothetical protein GU926_11440 [Nibribacter ruber]